MQRFDENKNGKLDYFEFINMCRFFAGNQDPIKDQNSDLFQNSSIGGKGDSGLSFSYTVPLNSNIQQEGYNNYQSPINQQVFNNNTNQIERPNLPQQQQQQNQYYAQPIQQGYGYQQNNQNYGYQQNDQNYGYQNQQQQGYNQPIQYQQGYSGYQQNNQGYGNQNNGGNPNYNQGYNNNNYGYNRMR